MNRIAKFIPVLLGLLFAYAGIQKLLHPGAATMALESLDLPYGVAKALVAGVIIVEFYLGTLLVLRKDLRYALSMATVVMFVFTGYLWYLATLANPPSCGCLGLTGIFENSRHEALFGLARNFLILCAIKWTYDRHFPKAKASAKTLPVPPAVASAKTN